MKQKLFTTIILIILIFNSVIPLYSFGAEYAQDIDEIVEGLNEYKNGMSFYDESSQGAFNTLVFRLWSIIQTMTQEENGVTATIEQMQKTVEGISILEELHTRYSNEAPDPETMQNMQSAIERKDAIQGFIDDGGIIAAPENPHNTDTTQTNTGGGSLILGFLDITFGILLYPIKLLLLVPGLIAQGVLSVVVSGGEGAAVIGVSIDQILFNQLAITDINVFSDVTATGRDLIGSSLIMQIRTFIANWYYAFRNLVIAIYLCILIYIGIRMAISSIAEDKAKYKNMLKNWFVGLALVMVLHIIIIFIIQINNHLLSVIQPTNASGEYTNLMGNLFGQAFWVDFTTSFGSVILYTILTVLTFIFLIIYVRRMITVSFLICVAPLITLTYPIDKAADNKSQILNNWLKEFTTDVLIQFFHGVIYVVLVQSSIDNMIKSGPLDFGAIFVSIVMICCMFYVEGIVKKLFGLDQGGSTFLKTLVMGKVLGDIGNNLKVIRGSRNDNQINTQSVPTYMPNGELTDNVTMDSQMPKVAKEMNVQEEQTTKKDSVPSRVGKAYLGAMDSVAKMTVPGYNAIKNKGKMKYKMNLKQTQKLFQIACQKYTQQKPEMTSKEFINKMESLNETKLQDIKDPIDSNMKQWMMSLEARYKDTDAIQPNEQLKKNIHSFGKKIDTSKNKTNS